MSLERPPNGFSDEDLRIFRLFKIVMCEGHNALLLVYVWGYLEKHNKSLIDHLKDTGMSKKDMKRIFDSTMRETMANDPTGKKYDVSLLHACIMYGCECLASPCSPDWREGSDDKVESLCTFVKNFRNRLTHGKGVKDESALQEDSSRLKEKLENLIRLAGSDAYYKRSKKEVEEEITNMKTSINNIMTTPLGDTESLEYKEALEKLREEQKNIVINVSNKNLPEQYKAMSRVDPASFITGEERLEVNQIFTQLEVVHEKKAASETVEEKIDYRNLFTLKTDKGEEPALVVVEGDAGAGKTTLSKLVLKDWADLKISENRMPVQFHSINNYELILFAEGRNKRISNFADLLTTLMPQADVKLTEQDLVRAVLRMKTLLILDGLDELNTASKNLIIDLLDKCLPSSENRLQLLITTRPHMVNELPSIVRSRPMIYTRLQGISPDRYEEFVGRLHETMISKGLSNQSTDHLIDYVRQSRGQMGEHYRLPLNLTLLTYLWAADPSRVNSVTTVTELYSALLELIESRLVERLHAQSNLCKKELQSLCHKFFQKLCNACLQTLKHHIVQLSSDSVAVLRKCCKDLGLKFEEMIAPFLSVEKDWTAYGYIFELFVPHKSIMEFYAAHRFLYELMAPTEDESYKENIIKEMEYYRGVPLGAEKRKEVLAMLRKESQSLPDLVHTLLDKDPEHDNLSPFQNVFIHLGGLLAHQEDLGILEKCAEELINIFENAKVPESKWLEFLTECKCKEVIAKLMAQKEVSILRVRDGHTGAALALLSHIHPQIPVEIVLETEVRYVPQLKELLEKVAKRPCKLEVLLKHQWKNPACGISDTHLVPVLDKSAMCTLIRVTGYLQDLSTFPDTVKNLRLSFMDDTHARKLIKEIKEHDMVLEYLGIHVMKEVDGETLEPLPMAATLWISKLNNDTQDLDRIVKVVKALMPPNRKYRSLFFPGSNFTIAGARDLVERLAQISVQMEPKGALKITCPILTQPEQRELVSFTREKLKCELHCTEEAFMW